MIVPFETWFGRPLLRPRSCSSWSWSNQSFRSTVRGCCGSWIGQSQGKSVFIEVSIAYRYTCPHFQYCSYFIAASVYSKHIFFILRPKYSASLEFVHCDEGLKIISSHLQCRFFTTIQRFVPNWLKEVFCKHVGLNL